MKNCIPSSIQTIPKVNSGEKIIKEIILEVIPKGNRVISTPDFGNDRDFNNLKNFGTFGKEIIKTTKYWDNETKIIQDEVNNIRRISKNISDYIVNSFIRVNTGIKYEINHIRDKASNALNLGKGDCSEYSDLFIALLRATDIPSRLIIGWVIKPSSLSLESHGWVEFYSPKYGWIQCDPTWGYLTGVSCQHLCRQREGITPIKNNFGWKYAGRKESKIEVKEKITILSID